MMSLSSMKQKIKAAAAAAGQKTKTAATKGWWFAVRWQEFISWAPATVIVALVVWTIAGGYDPEALKGIAPLFPMAAVKTIYVVLALGATHLVRKRWRYKMDADDQVVYWSGLCEGKRGHIVIFITDAVFTLCALFMLLEFFKLPS